MRVQSALAVNTRFFYLFVLLILSLGISACHPASIPMGRGILVDWSPDGAHIALVPDCINSDPESSGLWIFDSRTGQLNQPIPDTDTQICLHPRWSPDGTQILISIIDKQEADSHGESEPIPFSIYIVDAYGPDRRRVADSISTSADAFVVPNAIMWGTQPDTVIYQQAVGDKVTAMELNLSTNVSGQYLPDLADLYHLQPSPDRRHIVSLLYDAESQTARVYLSDFQTTNWRLLESLNMDSSTAKSFLPTIYWAPDSSAFVVSEKAEETPGAGRQYLHLFDIRTGFSQRICTCDRSSAIFWNREGTALLFSDDNPAFGEGIFRLDLTSGAVRRVIPGGQYTLLSWNQEDGRIYFSRTGPGKEDKSPDDEILEHRLLYCDGEGKVARLLGRFYTGNELNPIISPDGSRMVLFDDAFAPGYLNLTSGDGQPVALER